LKKDREFILYLDDIIDSIKKIQLYIGSFSYDQFVADSKTIDAVIRNFEVIGEASKNLPKELKFKYSNIPWDEMYRLRNRVSHEYFGIDFELIWDIIQHHLSDNLREIVKMREEQV
jgi:uncharacterized protein with HEPN domain